jgi:hypothetical protein
VAVQADRVQVAIPRVPVAVLVEAVQVVLVEAVQVVLEEAAATGPAASVVRHVVLGADVVVAIKTNCSRSSLPTRHLMPRSLKASSSLNVACPLKSSLHSSIARRPTLFDSC